MTKPRSYSIQEVFNYANIGFVAEFYSSRDSAMIIDELSRLSAKAILFTNNIKQTPTFSSAVLVKEYEGTKPRYSFKVAQQNFHTSVPIIKETLNWINDKCSCTKDTSFRVTLSFDHSRLKTVESISTMDVARLMLKFDESFVYRRFPDRSNTPYAMSIKNVVRITDGVYSFNPIKRKNSIIVAPEKDYDGINFKDHSNGLLEFNYVGGMNYAEKITEIIECVEYYVLKTYQSINEENYTREEFNELIKITKGLMESQPAYSSPDNFIAMYPQIKLYANLDNKIQTLRTFWHEIRQNLFEMILNNSFTSGEFNYDSTLARCQIRNASLSGRTIKGLDLVSCEVSGVLDSCNLFETTVKNSRIYRSKIASNNVTENCYMQNVIVDHNNLLEYCFVENDNETVNCEIRKSVIKFASVGSHARIDEHSVIIDKTYTPIDVKDGVQVEEFRDYRWLASMNKNRSDEFQNVYVKPKIKVEYD